MGIKIFLGEPPAHIKQWIIDHHGGGEEPDPVDNTAWGKLVAALEGGCSDASPVTVDGTTFNVGSGVGDVMYKIDTTASAVPTTWLNLGYNASIPEYVKYRRAVGSGWKHVWVKSTKSGLLAPIAVGDTVYGRAYSDILMDNTYAALEDEVVTAVGETSFTYGNNCTYSVPMSITTAKGEYVFCGYNLTINSEALLRAMVTDADAAAAQAEYNALTAAGSEDYWWDGKDANGNYYYTFDTQHDSEYGRNIYSSSTLRQYLNGVDPQKLIYMGYVCDQDWNQTNVRANVDPLKTRLASNEGLLKNVASAVNRTWVYPDFRSGLTLDSNSCEHVADKFWVLGCGNVNCTGSDGSTTYFEDANYDTSRFTAKFFPQDNIWESNDSRVKYLMSTSGSTSGEAYRWWLRSADCDYPRDVAYVDVDGGVHSDGASNYCGLSPACIIG